MAETDGEAEDGAEATGAGGAAVVLRKAEFAEAVAAGTGLKKAEVRPVLDAVLAEMGRALARGDALLLPPLGKLTVSRRRGKPGTEVTILKLKPAAEKAAKAAGKRSKLLGDGEGGSD